MADDEAPNLITTVCNEDDGNQVFAVTLDGAGYTFEVNGNCIGDAPTLAACTAPPFTTAEHYGIIDADGNPVALDL